MENEMELQEGTKRVILDKFIMIDWGEFSGFSDDIELVDLMLLRALIDSEIELAKHKDT
jgi:hypothetical protein